MSIGAALGLGGVLITALLDEPGRTVFSGLLLAVIGAVYFGFAVSEGEVRSIVVQTISMTVFFCVAYFGVTEDNHLLLGLGFLAHGIWDVFHHEHHGPTEVRTWYPPFCAVADFVLAVPLLAGWI